MQEYEFTLKFGLQETVINPLEHEGPLYSAGCDDALVGMGQQGRLALHFIREATSAHEAIASAIKNVRKAIPDARLIEATPDFVGLTRYGICRRSLSGWSKPRATRSTRLC